MVFKKESAFDKSGVTKRVQRLQYSLSQKYGRKVSFREAKEHMKALQREDSARAAKRATKLARRGASRARKASSSKFVTIDEEVLPFEGIPVPKGLLDT